MLLLKKKTLIAESDHILKIETLSPEVLSLLLEADPDKERVETYCLDGALFGYFRKNQCVGAVVWVVDTISAEIKNLSVVKDFRRNGIGKTLLEFAFFNLRGKGVQTLLIRTGNSSIPALKLYEKMGFVIDSIDEGYFIRNYPSPIFENNMQCTDQLTLIKSL
jgi:ribosomal protein S18 acetylase RimI-like enzyme